jgi:hypothetical protein
MTLPARPHAESICQVDLKALGLEIPDKLLGLADEVIE